MPFTIEWVDSCAGAEDVIKIQTPAGQLVLYRRQGVISRADWELDDGFCSQDHELQVQFKRYWHDTDTLMHIKLLRQGSA